MRYCYCEAKVCSSSVSVVYVVRLRKIFSKVTLQKRGSMDIEPSLDPPLPTMSEIINYNRFRPIVPDPLVLVLLGQTRQKSDCKYTGIVRQPGLKTDQTCLSGAHKVRKPH